MNATDALAFLGAELRQCEKLSRPNATRPEARDLREMVVLLIPALLAALDVQPLDEMQSLAVREELKQRKAAYKVNGTCCECQTETAIPITQFVDGGAAAWCDVCNAQRTFVLRTVKLPDLTPT